MLFIDIYIVVFITLSYMLGTNAYLHPWFGVWQHNTIMHNPFICEYRNTVSDFVSQFKKVNLLLQLQESKLLYCTVLW